LIGKTAVVAVASGCFEGANIGFSLKTGGALHARGVEPANADSLTDFQMVNLSSFFYDGANNFMAGNEGILRSFPIVVDEVNVAMAKTAVSDFEKKIKRTERGNCVAEGGESLAWSECGVSVNFHAAILSNGNKKRKSLTLLFACLNGKSFEQRRSVLSYTFFKLTALISHLKIGREGIDVDFSG
jgi:hypothetical protein